jgi:peroxiredoxin
MASMETIIGQMPERLLHPGDPAPNVVLDAISQQGRIAIDDFRGQKPVLIGLFRGLHCPFCRRHLAVQAAMDRELREKGVECIAVVNTPIDRARLYLRYHPLPDLLAVSDPERTSHRAFGLPNLNLAEVQGGLQRKFAVAATAALNAWDGYQMTEADRQMVQEGGGQLFGQFLIDREGIIRWCFTEEADRMLERPDPRVLMEAASQIAG